MNKLLSSSAIAIAVASLVAGCGGGGGGGGGGVAGGDPTPSISGVAAVGAPMVGAIVKVKCSGGPEVKNVQTGLDGAWQASIEGNTLPCAVQVSSGTIRGVQNNTEIYHSLANRTGVTNVTPFTDLILANAVGSDNLQTWFTDLPIKDAQALTATTQAQIEDSLAKLRAAFPDLVYLARNNPIIVSFSPVTGDEADDMLEVFRTAAQYTNNQHAGLLSRASIKAFPKPEADFLAAIVEAQRIKKEGKSPVAISGVIGLPAFSGMQTPSTMVGLNSSESFAIFSETLETTLKEQSFPFDYLNMSNGIFVLTDSSIKSSICMTKNLPDTIPVNKTGIPDYAAEYLWVTEIDTNGDGKADFLIQSSRYKKPSEAQSNQAINTAVETGFWRVNPEVGAVSTNSIIAEVPVELTVDGRCMNWQIPRSGAHAAALQGINSSARVRQYTQAITADTNTGQGIALHRDIYEGSGTNSVAPVVPDVPVPSQPEIPPEGDFRDVPAGGMISGTSSNQSIAHIDITGGYVAVDDTKILVTMYLRNVPEILFNRTGIPTNVFENYWRVQFDTDGDGKPNYVFSAGSVKVAGGEQYKSIKDGTQQEFQKHFYPVNGMPYTSKNLSNDFEEAKRYAYPVFTFNGNSISWAVDKSSHPELLNITSSAKVRFMADELQPWLGAYMGVKINRDSL